MGWWKSDPDRYRYYRELDRKWQERRRELDLQLIGTSGDLDRGCREISAVQSAQRRARYRADAEQERDWLERAFRGGAFIAKQTCEKWADRASRILLATRGRARIDALVERSGLCARHFQRRFTAQIGLAPKLYARTARFDAALMAHRRDPARRWTNIVHEAGYFDQAHFVRECHSLVNAAPSQFIGDWDNIFFPADD